MKGKITRDTLVELLNGLFWAVFYWQFGISVIGAAYALLASALLVMRPAFPSYSIF